MRTKKEGQQKQIEDEDDEDDKEISLNYIKICITHHNTAHNF